MSGLQKPLTSVRGTALMLNIVIGAGLLALPGLAVKQSGEFAFLAWGLCAIVAMPLLAVFVILGRNYPNAGGIAHFAQTAFGRRGYAVASLIFLGAVAFGLPSIALTGAHYAALLTGGSPTTIAILLLVLATSIHFFSSHLVAQANTILAGAILIIVITLIAVGLANLNDPFAMTDVNLTPNLEQLPLVLAPFMMIFFAFTGWEVAAGLSEEFENPKRDFPRAMIASFLIAAALYLLIAFIVQKLALSEGYEVAFAKIASNALGASGQAGISLVATVIIFANLSGAIWAVSRLVYSLSREGFLPAVFRKTKQGTPWVAVGATTAVLIIVLFLDWIGLLGLERMLFLAGQNFIILYGIAAAALFAMSFSAGERALSGTVIIIIAGLVYGQGTFAVYPIFLIGLGLVLARLPHKTCALDTNKVGKQSCG